MWQTFFHLFVLLQESLNFGYFVVKRPKSPLVNQLAVLNDVKALRKRRIRKVCSIVHGINQNFAAFESLASLLSEGGSSLQPVLNIGVAVNVIVASLPPYFKVAPFRWMGLGDIDSDKVGHLRKLLAQCTELIKVGHERRSGARSEVEHKRPARLCQ